MWHFYKEGNIFPSVRVAGIPHRMFFVTDLVLQAYNAPSYLGAVVFKRSSEHSGVIVVVFQFSGIYPHPTRKAKIVVRKYA